MSDPTLDRINAAKKIAESIEKSSVYDRCGTRISPGDITIDATGSHHIIKNIKEEDGELVVTDLNTDYLIPELLMIVNDPE